MSEEQDNMQYLVDVVLAIKDDPELTECFIRVLQMGSSTQQVRASLLLQELERLKAPDEVKNFVRLLGNDKLAHHVLRELKDENEF